MRKTIVITSELFNKSILPRFTLVSGDFNRTDGNVVLGGEVRGSFRYNVMIPFPGQTEGTQNVEADKVYTWSIQ